MALFTCGYEGQSIETFIARLTKAGVRSVLDIRELPLSRKKGFSKTAFGIALHRAGISYEHLPVLGCPRSIRDQYKMDGDWNRYEKRFTTYLASQSGVVAQLAKTCRRTSACLVCFEADFNVCHRSLVARAVARAGGPRVIHLTATTEITALAPRRAA